MKKAILLVTVLATFGLTTFLSPNLWALDVPLVGGKWWYRPAVKDELGLTPDQINKIDKIWIEHRKQLIDIKSDIEKAYLDLESMMGQPTVDTQEAYTLAESLGQLQARKAQERIRMAIDIRQELSLEQFEKLRGLRGELGKRHRQKMLKEGLKGESGKSHGQKMLKEGLKGESGKGHRQKMLKEGKRGRRGSDRD